jgi:hypothetical protein
MAVRRKSGERALLGSYHPLPGVRTPKLGYYPTTVGNEKGLPTGDVSQYLAQARLELANANGSHLLM